jgi:hypothetical protein
MQEIPAPGSHSLRHVTLGIAVRGANVARYAAVAVAVPLRLTGSAVDALSSLPPLVPVRRIASRSLDGLAVSGERTERRLRAQFSERGGSAVDAAVAAVIDAEVIDRVVQQLLDEGVAERVVAQVLSSPDSERLLASTLERPELERLIVLALENPSTDQIVKRVLESPGMEQAVTRVLESELLHETTKRVIESEEMQRIVERIANSPEVRDAIAQQSIGLADVLAREVRERSVAADDVAERLAQSLIHPRRRRGRTPDGEPGP